MAECTCGYDLLPIKHLNDQQWCVCGQYYQLCDYEGNLIEEGFLDFYKDIMLIQDYALDRSFLTSRWISFEFPIYHDLDELKDKIKLYILCS